MFAQSHALRGNAHAYHNDPVNFRDPSGLTPAVNPLNNVVGPVNQGVGTSSFDTLSGIGNVTRNVATSTFHNSNPIATSVVNAGLGLGAASLGLQTRSGPTRQSQPTSQGTGVIRELLPGANIVPRQIEDLPGVRQALENPDRFLITNHNDQGNFVLDVQGGGVRFVTGDEVLPIREHMRRARSGAQSAARDAAALTLVQEGLISVSPIHETSRDVGISLFGTDPFESQRQFTTREQVDAGFLLLVPGGNSGQVRLADGFIDDVLRRGKNKQISRLREFRAQQKFEGRFGTENVLTERLLLDSKGRKVIDPVTGEGRRLDFVILDDARNARFVPEITSRNQKRTGGKAEQILKERRIRNAGGTFVQDPQTKQLIDVSGIESRIIGVEPR